MSAARVLVGIIVLVALVALGTQVFRMATVDVKPANEYGAVEKPAWIASEGKIKEATVVYPAAEETEHMSPPTEKAQPLWINKKSEHDFAGTLRPANEYENEWPSPLGGGALA